MTDISFDEFAESLLADWCEAAAPAADATVTTPMMAAKRALYAAATCKGLIHVIVPSQSEQRSLSSYLTAMTKGQRMLEGFDRRITVTTAEAAPLVRDAAHVIELKPRDSTAVVPDSDMTSLRMAMHVAVDDAHNGIVSPQLLKLNELLGIDLAELHRQCEERMRQRREAKPDTPGFVSLELSRKLPPARTGHEAEPVILDGVGADGSFTPEWETRNVKRKTRGAMTSARPEVITSRSYRGSRREQGT